MDYMTPVSCFFDEFIGTAVLLLVVCAFTDRNNGPPPAGLVPLALFITILGIGTSLGMQTGYAINPARDFGPRLFTAMAGYGKDVFNYRNQFWLWCPIIAPICGALGECLITPIVTGDPDHPQVATFLYDAFIFTGAESILNKPNANARRQHERAPDAERQKPIAGVGPEMC